ncbi:hypothetical protein VTN00DRAFT_1772 [Thermoascus crustaceus]|uniref:uncharacterized protein n=1 Tax=Thermoascus crustaceus TaxID=5088 RepID=UPI0037426755
MWFQTHHAPKPGSLHAIETKGYVFLPLPGDPCIASRGLSTPFWELVNTCIKINKPDRINVGIIARRLVYYPRTQPPVEKKRKNTTQI